MRVRIPSYTYMGLCLFVLCIVVFCRSPMLFYDEDSKMLFIAMKVGPFDGS